MAKLMKDRPGRERLAISLFDAHKHAFGGVTHPQRGEWAWDALPSRQQDRWYAVVDALLEDGVYRQLRSVHAAVTRHDGPQ